MRARAGVTQAAAVFSRSNHGSNGLREQGAPDLPPVHPGAHLRDWLKQTGTSAYALAKAMWVPANRLGAILDGKRAITADTAHSSGQGDRHQR